MSTAEQGRYVWRCVFCGSSAVGDRHYRESVLAFGVKHRCSTKPNPPRQRIVITARAQRVSRRVRVAGRRG